MKPSWEKGLCEDRVKSVLFKSVKCSESDREASDKEASYKTDQPKRECYPEAKRVCYPHVKRGWKYPKPKSKSVELLNPLGSRRLSSTQTGKL